MKTFHSLDPYTLLVVTGNISNKWSKKAKFGYTSTLSKEDRVIELGYISKGVDKTLIAIS